MILLILVTLLLWAALAALGWLIYRTVQRRGRGNQPAGTPEPATVS